MTARDYIIAAGGAWPDETAQPMPLMQPPKRGILSRALSLGRALVGGFADRWQWRARLIACGGCDSMQRAGGEKYCGSCGCGQHALSELRVKVRLAGATCPLNRW
jgi:hypothetical protein